VLESERNGYLSGEYGIQSTQHIIT